MYPSFYSLTMRLRTTSEVEKLVEQVTQSQGSQVVIGVWADVGCPWCDLGKDRLRAAIAQRPDADRFKIVMRSFEREPGAPHEPEKNEQSYIRTHGGTAADVLRAEPQMQAMARAEGLEYYLDHLNANTFDLHRVVQYADDQDRGFEFFSTVQDGFFAGTLDPHDPDTLTGVTESVGLDGRRVREILASNEDADRVRASRNEATPRATCRRYGAMSGSDVSACRRADGGLASADSGQLAGGPVAGDLTVVGGGPTSHRRHRIHQGAAQFRQRVLHSRWDLGVRGPRDQSISFEVLERLGQHPLGDPGDARLQVGVAQRAGAQGADDQHRPLVADAIEHLADEGAVLRPCLARTSDPSR
ncbi:hypothetical protein GCM10023169_23550 [Georgenia halophila]|uniref:DSBA-like thioredoxin domain-containing protein n=1 Tax=Georgenia halophila TaxID=620889 RepID=A0ABP8L9X7_9MICO